MADRSRRRRLVDLVKGRSGSRSTEGQKSVTTPTVAPECVSDGAVSTSTTMNSSPAPFATLFGLKCLTPDLEEEQLALGGPDFVAIHGINGDPMKTWTHTDNGALWLRDFLPERFPGSRVYTFGYDARVAFTTSKANLQDFARSLLGHLKRHRSKKEHQSRPLVFICHSMGGIVVKQALILARLETHQYPFIYDHVKGILFLSTPHRGSESTKWPLILTNIAKFSIGSGPFGSFRTDLLASLEEKSKELLAISRSFRNQEADIKIISCYEQNVTSPFPYLIVDQYTGVLGFQNEILIPMSGCDHHTVCRFSTKNDQNYLLILKEIEDLVGCLKSLAFNTMENRLNDVSPAADDTCGWLHEHKMFKEWLSLSRGLLWIRGNPGVGKSTLLKYALRTMTNIETASTSANVLLISFFFHGRGVELQKTPLGLFRSILYQLLDKAPRMLSKLVETFKKNCDNRGIPGKDWNWHAVELQDMLKASLPKILGKYSIRIFVDALDECGETAALKLVGEFRKLIVNAPVTSSIFGICFSCRHYPILALQYGLEICVEQENNQDIATYVQNELRDSKHSLGESIIKRAQGNFQWAFLVVRRIISLELKAKSLGEMGAEIQRIPQDLEKLYRELLGNLSTEERPRSLKLLQWILFAVEPLTLDELRFAMVIDADTRYTSLQECKASEEYTDDNNIMERRVRDLSAGLAEVRSHKNRQLVQFIHQSVNDFLLLQNGLPTLDNNQQSIDWAIGNAHYRLSRSCILYLSMEEIAIEVIKNTRDKEWDLQKYNHCGPILKSKFPFLHYATISWVKHAQQTEARNISCRLKADLLVYLNWPSMDLVQQWIQQWVHIVKKVGFQNAPSYGVTLLHVVSMYGLITPLEAILKSLDTIDHGANVLNADGQTSLLCAAKLGQEAAVKLLLVHNDVDINTKDNIGRSPLSYAAEDGNEAIVMLLLARSDVEADSKDIWGRSPIFYAAMYGNVVIVKLLLARSDVEADSRDNEGRSPLFYVADSEHEAIAKLLLAQSDVEANSKDDIGHSPLSNAAMHGRVAIMKLLLAQSIVEADSRDKWGRSPLFYAAAYGHEAAVKLLLAQSDVEADSKDNEGYSPLSCAARFGDEAVVKLLLAQSDVEADSKDLEGRSPLSYAAEYGREAIVRLLLAQRDVDANSEDSNGHSPLWWAQNAKRTNEAVVELLEVHTVSKSLL